jgi:hypothetical protein
MHLLTLAKDVIDSIQLEHNERRFPHLQCSCHLNPPWPKVSSDSLMKLQTVFPEKLIIAALDLIDRGSGKYLFLLVEQKN